MFILQCACGNEIYATGEEEHTAWQCNACGKWYNFFGMEVPGSAPAAEFYHASNDED